MGYEVGAHIHFLEIFLKAFCFVLFFEGGYPAVLEHLLKRQIPTNYLSTFTEKLQTIRVTLSSINRSVCLSETSTTSSRLLYFCLKFQIFFFFLSILTLGPLAFLSELWDQLLNQCSPNCSWGFNMNCVEYVDQHQNFKSMNIVTFH